jgi:hypothetical protein
VGAFHNGSSGERVISLAFPAPKDVRTSIEPIRLTLFVAPDAAEPITPADGFKIGGTSRVARKQLLEFRQGARKRQIVGVEHQENWILC